MLGGRSTLSLRVATMSLNVSAAASLRFGVFVLDLETGELRNQSGVLIKLQPQPAKVLVLLASRPGQLVTREEIQQQLWQGETFVDYEHGVNFCIKQIRAALGDDAQAPRYVETLPRRGYRFIAPVERPEEKLKEESDEPAPPVKLAPEPPANPQTRRYSILIASLTTAVVLVVAAYLAWQRWGAQAPPPAGKIMLAVLPFENLSASPEQDYFSDGLTEEMITQLGRLHPQRLGVIARTSAMTYKGGKKDVSQIGHELGVSYVLEGSVRRDGDQLRITAQLIQVRDQSHLWAETYDRHVRDILAIQQEVAGRIARSLAVELLPSEQSAFAPSSVRSPEAYDAYLKGRYLWNKGTGESLKQSIEYFEQAVGQDPNFALAYAGLADAYHLLATFSILPSREVYPKAKAAALKALELDDSLSEAHTTLGSALFRFDWNWAAAEKSFRRALELNPSSAIAHHDYAWYLVALGRFEEGIAEIKRAQALDPLSPRANVDIGWVYIRTRRFDEAIAHIRRLLEFEPNSVGAQHCLEQAYMHQGQYDQALAEARKNLAPLGRSPEEVAALSRSDAAQGMRTVLRWRLERLQESARQRYVSPNSMAALYAVLDEKDQAFEWLERAYQERDPALVSLKVDPVYDNLRVDRRFAELVRRLDFPK